MATRQRNAADGEVVVARQPDDSAANDQHVGPRAPDLFRDVARQRDVADRDGTVGEMPGIDERLGRVRRGDDELAARDRGEVFDDADLDLRRHGAQPREERADLGGRDAANDQDELLDTRRDHRGIGAGDVAGRPDDGEGRAGHVDAQFVGGLTDRPHAHARRQGVAGGHADAAGPNPAAVGADDRGESAEADDLVAAVPCERHGPLELLHDPVVVGPLERARDLARGQCQPDEAQMDGRSRL